MKNWLIVALLLSVGLNLGLLAKQTRHRRPAPTTVDGERSPERGDAENGERRHGEGPEAEDRRARRRERFVARIADELGVEGEQRRLFAEKQAAFFDQMRELRRQYRRQAGVFRENMTAAEPDRAAARAQLREMAATQEAIELAWVENFFATRELLDAEQQVRYREIVQRLRQWRWQRWAGDGDERRHRRERGERRRGER